MEDKIFFSIPEVARMLSLSRIAVYKKVKAGQIRAQKIGRNFAIPKVELAVLVDEVLTSQQKKVIDQGVRKTVKEYGETLKKLGNE